MRDLIFSSPADFCDMRYLGKSIADLSIKDLTHKNYQKVLRANHVTLVAENGETKVIKDRYVK